MASNLVFTLIVMIAAMCAAIVLLVFGILLLISNLAGWGALTRKYESKSGLSKGALLEEKKQRKAWVGAISFGGMVTARAYEDGLELTTKFPFSPPLFFPWDAISEYRLKRWYTYPMLDQFVVDGRTVRLTNHLQELKKRKRTPSG